MTLCYFGAFFLLISYITLAISVVSRSSSGCQSLKFLESLFFPKGIFFGQFSLCRENLIPVLALRWLYISSVEKVHTKLTIFINLRKYLHAKISTFAVCVNHVL